MKRTWKRKEKNEERRTFERLVSFRCRCKFLSTLTASINHASRIKEKRKNVARIFDLRSRNGPVPFPATNSFFFFSLNRATSVTSSIFGDERPSFPSKCSCIKKKKKKLNRNGTYFYYVPFRERKFARSAFEGRRDFVIKWGGEGKRSPHFVSMEITFKHCDKFVAVERVSRLSQWFLWYTSSYLLLHPHIPISFL